MRRKAIICALTIMAVVLMALSTIPLATSDSSGARQAVNIAPLAQGSSSGGGRGIYGPNSMNDLNVNNMCWVFAPRTGAYFQLTWPRAYSIGNMFVKQHGSWSNPGRRNLAGCDIQWWNGMTWITDGRLSNLNSDFPYTFTSAVTTDRIRMTNLVCSSYPGQQSSNPCVYEWYVYEGESGIPADVRLEPQSLNLDSNGNWVSLKVLGFPDNPEYSPLDVDGSSCTVGGVGAELKFGTWNDNKYIGKADRLLVEDSIGTPGNDVEVEVTGRLSDGTGFMGNAVINAH